MASDAFCAGLTCVRAFSPHVAAPPNQKPAELCQGHCNHWLRLSVTDLENRGLSLRWLQGTAQVTNKSFPARPAPIRQ